MALFGTSGIRGIYGKDVNDGLASKITYIFAGTCKQEKIVVGRDTRESGERLFEAIASTGMGIIDLGVVPTPTLALATMKHKCPGIMITASHNPPEYNGLKLLLDGAEIPREMEKKIEKEYFETITSVERKAPHVTKDHGAIKEHMEAIKKAVDSEGIKSKKFKVIIDCNGAGSVLTPYLLQELGCNVLSINAETSGFNRASEPNEKNLQHLIGIMKAVGADVGFAHDGDADRVIVIDENGEILPLDVQLAIMIEHELDNAKTNNKTEIRKIISTVEASLLIRETIEKNKGTPIITRVSSVEISELMKKENAVFGGEPCGEYVFSGPTRAPDGPLAVAKFLEIITQKGKFNGLKRKYVQYPILRDKFKCERKYEAVAKIIEQVKQMEINGKITTIDGLRVDEKDGWFLIRTSGTEPIIRLTAEYRGIQALDRRVKEISQVIKSVVSI
ncbi:MAG: phosphoglucosamine mutase [Candidatus Micrarchaeota archaeon]